MSQLWKSELNPGLHPSVEKLNRSLDRDIRLWKEDILGSKAHVQMLLACKLISKENGAAILVALDLIQIGIQNGEIKPEPHDEDVHSWIERELTQRLGSAGSNVHIARSRNEQVLLDMKLYLRSSIQAIQEQLYQSMQSLKELKKQAGETILPSYTHLRRAQPIYLKEYWDAHLQAWGQTQSNLEHLLSKINEECPMGAGAIHGTTLATEPQIEAILLGFKRAPTNTLATISSRNMILEFLSVSCHWFLDLSRLMEDLIFFSTEEVKFISLAPAVTTGSSMMPQKRNPDLCELIRGKSASVIGNYMAMLTLMKGLPMGYMKDLQEDKIHLFSVVDDVKDVLDTLPVLLQSIQIHPKQMESACSDPSLLATDLMEYLVANRMPLRDAHHQVARWISQNPDYLKAAQAENPGLPPLSPKQSCEIRYQRIQKWNEQDVS